MEEDRYRTNNKLYSLGIVSLLLSLSLFAFSFYILPNLLFGWKYDTPEFIMHFREWLQWNYHLSEIAAARLTLASFFLLAIIFGVIAYIASNRVDDQIYEDAFEKSQPSEPIAQRKTISESMGFGLKVFFILIAVVLFAILFELAIRSTSPEPVDESRQYVR